MVGVVRVIDTKELVFKARSRRYCNFSKLGLLVLRFYNINKLHSSMHTNQAVKQKRTKYYQTPMVAICCVNGSKLLLLRES